MGRKSRLKRERKAREAETKRLYGQTPPVKYPVQAQASAGTTGSERRLASLSRDTFLSLWSYPNVVRREPQANGGVQGKELADLLVVFDNDVVLFSDKDCAFGDSGNVLVDWARWYRRAIACSAKQLWGAERQLRSSPENVFVDRACQVRLPVALPPPDRMRIHRVVVANGASERCRKELGGSGSLVVAPQIVGDAHTTGERPFAVGQIHPSKPFVHVFDDTSLRLVMLYFDTVSDFVGYLRKREALIVSGRLGIAIGEEALMGHYVGELNAQGERDFVLPPGDRKIGLREESWQNFLRSPELKSKLAADEISYAWDRIIEEFTRNFRGGTSDFISAVDSTTTDFERLLRWFARENRLRRRILAQSLHDMLTSTSIKQRRIRVIPPSAPGDPHWVFVLFPFAHHLPISPTHEDYRRIRRNYLDMCLSVVKLENPHALDIVGFVTESGRLEAGYGSEDAAYFDARNWTPENAAHAREVQAKAEILVKPDMLPVRVSEYPTGDDLNGGS